jgi:thiol-disulfide isomerase/thioredoxin
VPVTDLADVLKRHEKRPLLLNIWATWCGPCRVEFPELVSIDRDFRQQGLDVVIVSLDNLGALDSVVTEFLRSHDATMPSYLLDLKRERAYSNIRRRIPAARRGVPLTILFDAKGRVRYVKSGIFNPDVLRANVLAVIK